jgi:uncharacterized pyridoxal phosphate-containing UPF0001 family protein
VQEAEGRWPPLRAEAPGFELHLVGPLQTNKLARAVQARGACPLLFVQVNTGREPQKAGLDPETLDAFLATCRGSYGLPVAGLMCLPPADADPAPHFAALAAMAERNDLALLSMGMSDDFETAVAHGATHVRIGSAIFGARPGP